MSGDNYDPVRTPAPKRWSDLGHSSNCDGYCCAIVGPGGKETNIENNEKGMLDQYVLSVANTITGEELPSNHDSYSQGIYKTHGYASGPNERD